MSPHDLTQINHVARLAVLAMCARGCAASEFDQSPEITEIRFIVSRDDGAELAVDVEYIGAHSMPIGGMSL